MLWLCLLWKFVFFKKINEGKWLEWTHTVVHQSCYLEMLESLDNGWGWQHCLWRYPLRQLCQQHIPTWSQSQHIPQPWIWPSKIVVVSPAFIPGLLSERADLTEKSGTTFLRPFITWLSLAGLFDLFALGWFSTVLSWGPTEPPAPEWARDQPPSCPSWQHLGVYRPSCALYTGLTIFNVSKGRWGSGLAGQERHLPDDGGWMGAPSVGLPVEASHFIVLTW